MKKRKGTENQPDLPTMDSAPSIKEMLTAFRAKKKKWDAEEALKKPKMTEEEHLKQCQRNRWEKNAMFSKLVTDLSEKVAGLYHASPKKLRKIDPRNRFGDLRVDAAVFASPMREYALPYAGKKWTGIDLAQFVSNCDPKTKKYKHKLLEMRPGAFKDVFRKRKGYIYTVDRGDFKSLNRYEAITNKAIKPKKKEEIKDLYEELKGSDIELVPFGTDAKLFKREIKRIKNRAKRMDSKNRKYYLNWVKTKSHPEVVKAMFGKMASGDAVDYYRTHKQELYGKIIDRIKKGETPKSRSMIIKALKYLKRSKNK